MKISRGQRRVLIVDDHPIVRQGLRRMIETEADLVVCGEVQTERLSIEEGAVLKGKVEAGKQPSRTTDIKAAAAAASKSSDTTTLSSGTAAD